MASTPTVAPSCPSFMSFRRDPHADAQGTAQGHRLLFGQGQREDQGRTCLWGWQAAMAIPPVHGHVHHLLLNREGPCHAASPAPGGRGRGAPQVSSPSVTSLLQV